MTWQTAAYALSVLSIAAQAVAVDEVRAWSARSRQTIARHLRIWWRRLARRPQVVHDLSGTVAVTSTVSMSWDVLPAGLDTFLADHIARTNQNIAQLSADRDRHEAILAALEARARDAEETAAEQAAEARLTGAWVIAGAVLASLALLAQVLASMSTPAPSPPPSLGA